MTWEDYLNLVLKSSGIDMTMKQISDHMFLESLKEITQTMIQKKPNDKLVIFDLDGCISDDRWRRCLIEPSAIGEQVDNYGAYHDKICEDTVIEGSRILLKNYIAAGVFPIFITARPTSVRASTEKWIKDSLGLTLSSDYWMFMRAEGDYRSSVDIKREVIKLVQAEAAKSQRTIIAAFDDRTDIVDMYFAEGVIHSYKLDEEGLLTKYGRFSTSSLIGQTPGMIIDEKAARESFIKRSEIPSAIDKPFPIGEFVSAVADHLANYVPEIPDTPITQVATGAALDELVAIPLRLEDASDILRKAANTFRERNAVYRDNAVNVGKVMEALFPDGVNLKNAKDHQIYHLFELIIVKLTRFANTDLHHTDSIHDVMVYAAMIEPLCGDHNVNGSHIEKKEEKK
jgi:hypothetical protein